MKSLYLKSIFCIIFGLIIFTNTSAQNSTLTVIGNSQSVPSELNMVQLKSVLKGERLRWNDGGKVLVALMKTNTPIGSNTCEKIYKMSGNELNKYFLALVFQGKAKAPAFFNSESELENYVAQTPGAIGVLQKVSGTNLTTVLVEGKSRI